MNDSLFTAEDLYGADDRTWRKAKIWASVDPAVAATVAEVKASYSALEAMYPAATDEPTAPTSHDWFNRRIRRVR